MYTGTKDVLDPNFIFLLYNICPLILLRIFTCGAHQSKTKLGCSCQSLSIGVRKFAVHQRMRIPCSESSSFRRSLTRKQIIFRTVKAGSRRRGCQRMSVLEGAKLLTPEHWPGMNYVLL